MLTPTHCSTTTGALPVSQAVIKHQKNLLTFNRENQEDQAGMEIVESLDYRYGKSHNNDLLIIGFGLPYQVSQVNDT